MLHIVICDDESETLCTLRKYVDLYALETHQSLKISTFLTGEELLTKYPKDTDILLLDIDLKTKNGLKIAERLRSYAPHVCIIFITTLAQYAIKCYSVRAFGFLAKPVSYQVIKRELDAALKNIKHLENHYISLKDAISGLQRQINIKDIMYFEVIGHRLSIHLQDETITIRGSISQYAEHLEPHGFLRCHAGFLVNYRYIKAIDIAELILNNDTVIPISKGRKKAFMEDLTVYIGEMV